MSKTTNKFSPEVRARTVRMVPDHEGERPSRRAAIVSISEKIGCVPQTLHEWVKKGEVDNGRPAAIPTVSPVSFSQTPRRRNGSDGVVVAADRVITSSIGDIPVAHHTGSMHPHDQDSHATALKPTGVFRTMVLPNFAKRLKVPA